MDKMAQAADGSLQRSSTVSFASGLVERFKESTIHVVSKHLCKITAKCGKNDSDAEERLMFVHSGYILGEVF